MDQHLRNLTTFACIPNCIECPGKWKNEQIDHLIVCKCKVCKHGKEQIHDDSVAVNIQDVKCQTQSGPDHQSCQITSSDRLAAGEF